MSNKNNTLLNEHKHTNFNIQPSFEEMLLQNITNKLIMQFYLTFIIFKYYTEYNLIITDERNYIFKEKRYRAKKNKASTEDCRSSASDYAIASRGVGGRWSIKINR